jgi:hypothetical protein
MAKGPGDAISLMLAAIESLTESALRVALPACELVADFLPSGD